MKVRSRRGLITLLAMLAACAAPAALLAQDGSARCPPPGTSAPADLLALDLASLLSVKVTTASKFSESQAEAPGIISVVSRDELRRFGGTTLREILERVPGLAWSSAYFTDRSMVAARGDQTKINGGHVLFLVNGRPTREVLEGGLTSDLLESFPVNILERIEIVKGPGSVLYGSNAFSAVVNLITVRSEGNGFSLNGAPGANGARSASGEGTFACGNLSLVGGGQIHQKPDWSRTYWFNNPIPDDPFAAGVPLVQTAVIRDHSRGGFVGADYKGLSAMSSFTEWRTAAFVRGTVGESHWQRAFADVGYTMKATAVWTMDLHVSYTRNLFAIEQLPSIKRASDETVIEWTNVVNLTDRDGITFGALYNYARGHETYYGLGFPLQISNGQRSASAAYAQIDHRLVEQVKLIGGFQANKIGHLALDLVPRAGVIWNAASRVNVKVLYGQAFRAPSINETTLNHPGLAGTPGLRPEKVATVDVELSYHGERIQGSVDYFHSKQTDSITTDVSQQQWRYQNLGEATFHGVELEGKIYFTKSLFALGSFLHQANKDGSGARNITPVPNTSTKGGVSYQTEGGVTASLFDSYQGSVNGFSSILNPAAASRHLLSAHVRLELAAALRTPRAAGLAFVLDADNLGNEQVWLPDWGGNTGDTIPARRGRTVYVGVEVSMGGRAGSRAPIK